MHKKLQNKALQQFSFLWLLSIQKKNILFPHTFKQRLRIDAHALCENN